MKTLEGKVTEDSDRLDALGAIGIARAFVYGGSKSRSMHDPSIQPTLHTTSEEFLKSGSITVNHFHEKLFLLRDLMNTKEAMRIAEERTKFMNCFLSRFMSEWYGME